MSAVQQPVKKRASEKQEIRQKAEKMRSMLRDQEESHDGKKSY